VDQAVQAIQAFEESYLKDPDEPTFKNDAGMNEWRDFMAKYMPGANSTDGSYAYAYAVSKAMLQVLKRCEGNSSRARTSSSRQPICTTWGFRRCCPASK
jgi:branched-chain amino acid transport system substrate-binding protein